MHTLFTNTSRRHGHVYKHIHVHTLSYPLRTEAKSHHFPLCTETQELWQTTLCVHSSIPNHALSSPPSLFTSALQFRMITLLSHMIDNPEIRALLTYHFQAPLRALSVLSSTACKAPPSRMEKVMVKVCNRANQCVFTIYNQLWL